MTDLEWKLNQIFAKPLKEEKALTPKDIDTGNGGVFSLPIGKFPLTEMINEGTLKIIARRNEIQTIKSDLMNYNGQVSKAGSIQGFGRLEGAWGTYEGEYYTASKQSFGRMVFD